LARRRRSTKKVNKKSLVIIFAASLIMTTALTFGIAMLSGVEFELPQFGSKAELPSSSQAPQEEPAPVIVEKAVPPAELRAVMIKPSRDFSASASQDKQQESINEALDAAEELKMNAVVIDTLTDDGAVFYKSSFLEGTEHGEFDPLAYAIEAAKARGFYTMLTYNITSTAFEDEIAPLGKATSALIDGVRADISSFAALYQPDAVMLDGYYNKLTQKSYANYTALGGGAGFEDYMCSVTESLVRIVREEIERTAPSVTVGLLSEAVWANSYEEDNGSQTKALFCTFADGYADTLDFIKKGLADFVAVKAYGSIDDGSIPYQTVAAWWSDNVSETGIPLYIVHAAHKAVSDNPGWGEYDQLARQVIEAREMPGYGGSIFNSLERLIENPEDCATKLVGYYDGVVKAEHIMQDLELTKPAKTTFTSFDPTVLFAGNTDPNTDSTINGVKINTDENGYFQLEMDLSEGENVFKINHKGKTVTYNITRITEVVKEVSPGSGTLKVDGATKLTIDAVAYGEAKVYAVIGGKTITLKEKEETGDDEYRDTHYKRFTGVYTVPDAEAEDKNLGAITVYGEWNDIKKSKQGASIIINKRRLPSDGTPIVITSATAETFRGDTVSQYSEPTYFPLPKGALDYAVGDEFKYSFTNKNQLQTYNFYLLQSGLRVFTEDIAPVSVNAAAVDNAITGCTVTSDDRYTKVILKSRQQVAYSGEYLQDKLTFKFHYTNSLPDSMTLTKNPLFSAVEFEGSTMTLVLREKGKFMGMHPYYDNEGNLVLRFNNPPDAGGRDLSGVKIVIDPGHGGNDSGALGYLSAYPERVINYSIATKLASVLRSRGAEVVMYNTQYTNYSLAQRVAMAAEHDPHLFISVHCNSSAYNATAKGTEAYYFNYWSSGLAQFVSANVSNALGTTNRGQKHGYYAVTRSMQYPAILLETGFMSNQNEYHKLVNDSYQSNVATAIANGIGQYITYMGSSAGLTGTQTSGSSASDAGQNSNADTNLTDNGAFSSSSSAAGELTLDASSISLAAGEETDLAAEWSGEGDVKIVWSAEGSGDAAELGSDGDTLHITAKKAGEIKITASVEGNSSISAQCIVTVE